MTTIWSGGWILTPIKISDKTPPGFHPRWNMSFILEQTLAFKWDLLLIKTTHGNNAVPEKTGQCIISYCFIGEDMSKSWDSCFIRFQTLVDEARSPSFWHMTLNTLYFFACFWTLSCCILRVGILDLLTFFCWYRGTDCEQKKQYNQTINPLHYRVDVTYESIWYPERLKSLSHWCWYLEMLLVKNKQDVSSQGLLKSLIFHKDIETPNVAHLLCIWKVMTLKVNFKDLLLRSEAWKYHTKRPEKGRKVKMVRWMMTFHLRNRGYYMALRRH